MRQTATTAVVLGKLFPRDDAEVSQQAFEKLRGSLAGPIALRDSLPAPAPIFGILIDDLIVWNDLPVANPFGWSPIAVGRSRAPQGTLADWMPLPWGGPQRVILPGFHTPAENSLRRRGSAANGQEMFLSICGLMANGARTVLISRWRTGGQTSLSLVNEFMQELPHAAPASAWQQSVLLSQARQLDWNQEPRLRKFKAETPPLADHPFFWAGYLLVDDGTLPRDEEENLVEKGNFVENGAPANQRPVIRIKPNPGQGP